jgi:hypothetical protein
MGTTQPGFSGVTESKRLLGSLLPFDAGQIHNSPGG